MSRSFTIESVKRGNKSIKIDGGRYLSESPMAAAKKAFSQACRFEGAKGKCSMTISIKETTAGSNKKIYTYKASRVIENKQVERDGIMINYKYATKIHSV